MGLLSFLGRVLTKDLSGRTWTREASHPYFPKLVYFGSKQQDESYWEAELPMPGTGEGRVSATMKGTVEGPTEQEVQFCKSVVADPDALFEKCREAFALEFAKWSKRPWPAKWREAFALDGLEIPPNGDPSASWNVCYFVEPAGHHFTAEFSGGKVQRVAVDG